jgi:hypothetical protein
MVALNGNLLGRNLSGYAPFAYGIAEHPWYGGKNVLVVRVDATEHVYAMPGCPIFSPFQSGRIHGLVQGYTNPHSGVRDPCPFCRTLFSPDHELLINHRIADWGERPRVWPRSCSYR